MKFSVDTDTFPKVVEAYRAGDPVIIVDASDRENEGDLAVATEKITPDHLGFMMRHARGLICTSISPELSRRLQIPLQVYNNNSAFKTAFTVSVDHRSVMSTGVTASARSMTMRMLLDESSGPSDFVSPGNVFPLIANPAGVIGRQGQTEGSFDLARIAGLQASGVICEILNEDGTVTTGDALREYAHQHRILITSVGDIIRHRLGKEAFVRKVAESELATDHGKFRVSVFNDDVSGKEHLALQYGRRARNGEAQLVRIHSECLTGDVFGSRRCDCSAQLHHAMKMITREGQGIILYLRQEGRGIGLANKLRAYELQDQGLDTVEANVELGFQPDERDFAVAASMLSVCGVETVRLLTNNPQKVEALTERGIAVTERVPVIVPDDPLSRSYLETKRSKLGHLA